jgi:hypothetical protein
MQTIYRNTRNLLYKIANLAELKIRNTYYLYRKTSFLRLKCS